MKKTELLAPAKDKLTAFAAIDCGADAVYIGANSFGARQNARNTIEDIEEVVNYAHKFWAKVFVTINTILSDSELDEAIKIIKRLDEINVDAVLIQDMGLLKKLIEIKPQLKVQIHASTQCDNRLSEKVKFFSEIGLSRVVLARELSISQIKKIHEENPNIELEAFIHGALCVSYSGQCYLSQYIGGRSANRGECAQPCRKKYSVLNNNGECILKDAYPLSLKDFNASNDIKELIEAGIYSFKIEGRLKDVGYVKNIVSYYRKELDKFSRKISSGKSTSGFIADPEKSFNRGFTNYFLNGRTDCFNIKSPKSRGKCIGKIKEVKQNYIVITTNNKINPQDGLCYYSKNLEGFLVNKVEQKKLEVIVYPNKPLKIGIGTDIYKNYDVVFEKQLALPIKRQIAIDVKYDNKILEITDENNVVVKIEIASNEVAKNQEKMNETFKKQFLKTGESDFYINSFEIKNNLPFLTISEINALRRGVFEKLTKKRIEEYRRDVQTPLRLARYFKNEVDYRANIHNKSAREFYTQIGVKVLENSLESKIPNRQIELMRTKHCIKFALNMCKSSQNLFLEDEKHTKYPLLFDCKNCEMVILSPNPCSS